VVRGPQFGKSCSSEFLDQVRNQLCYGLFSTGLVIGIYTYVRMYTSVAERFVVVVTPQTFTKGFSVRISYKHR
jgi:hypothetical protein